MPGSATELFPVFQNMMNKMRHLLGVGIRVSRLTVREHQRHSLIDQRKEQPLKALDFVVMSPVNHGQADVGVIKAVLVAQLIQGQFGQEFGLGIVGQFRMQIQALMLAQVFARR